MRLGISQYALGVAAGIDEMSASPRINQYERGKHAPDFTMAKRLAAALQIPPAYLYAEDESLAELILLFWGLSEEAKDKALTALRGLAAKLS